MQCYYKTTLVAPALRYNTTMVVLPLHNCYGGLLK